MMKRILRVLLSLLAIIFPWMVFLLEGDLVLAFFGMALQVSLIGWIPISITAWKHRENFDVFRKNKEVDEPSKPSEKAE